MPKNIKILGERNSGTNFLTAIMRGNFAVTVHTNIGELSPAQNVIFKHKMILKTLRNKFIESSYETAHIRDLATQGGWKHACVTPRFIDAFARPNDCHILCIVRHPLAWARSMHKNPFHAFGLAPQDFTAFLNTPWRTRPRDELGSVTLASPLCLWREKLLSYQCHAKTYEKLRIICYEDLVLETAKTLGKLGQILPRKHPDIRIPVHDPRSFVDSTERFPDYQQKARVTDFSELSKQTYAPFETHIGTELMDSFGYTA
ncbi:MAG: hypothetical protein V3V13_08940 [Paracoccaceae bacterium]